MISNELMEQLRYIEIYTTRVVKNHIVGQYRSTLHGHGFELDEHKRYQPGDDYRQIDWNVTARMRYPYIRKDIAEKELNIIIVADLSRSMEFTTAHLSKRELLMRLTATIAFSAVSDNIAVGFLGFTDAVEEYIPPAKGRLHAWKILERLWKLDPKAYRTNLSCAFKYLNGRLKKMSLIFLISDFISKEDILESQYLKVLIKRHDLIPLVIEDKFETTLPESRGFLRLRDVEHGDELTIRLYRKNLRHYEHVMHQRKEELKRTFYQLNLDHLFLRSDKFDFSLILGFFQNRKSRR